MKHNYYILLLLVSVISNFYIISVNCATDIENVTNISNIIVSNNTNVSTNSTSYVILKGLQTYENITGIITVNATFTSNDVYTSWIKFTKNDATSLKSCQVAGAYIWSNCIANLTIQLNTSDTLYIYGRKTIAGGLLYQTNASFFYDYVNNPPSLSFIQPTDNNGSIYANYEFVNTSTEDSDNDYTSTILNWNDSLVGWWKFNEYSGNTIIDSLSNNNGTWNSSSTSINRTIGKFGKAIDFNGIDGFINIPASDKYNFSGAYTLEAWIYPRTLGNGSQGRIAENTQTTSWTGFKFALQGTNQIRVYNSGDNLVSLADSVVMNNWNHIVFTTDPAITSSNAKIYVNGIEKDSETTSYYVSNSNNLTIGATLQNTYNFDGIIDDIKIYNRMLTNNEVNASYNSSASRYYNNFTDLSYNQEYQFTAYAQDKHGNTSETLRAITPIFSNLKVVPSEGTATYIITTWNTSGNYHKNFTVTASNTSSNLTITVCNQTRNSMQSWNYSGSFWQKVKSNDTGCTVIYYNNSNVSVLTFTVTQLSSELIDPSTAIGIIAVGTAAYWWYRRRR